MSKKLLLLAVVAALLSFNTGCTTSSKASPMLDYNSGVTFEGGIERQDYVVLDRVVGSSMSQKYLLGLVEVVEPDVAAEGGEQKIVVFGIPFFHEKKVPVSKGFFGLGADNVANRAYYKALAAQPEADVILHRSIETKTSGIPFLWEDRTVTYVGKAIRLKSNVVVEEAPAVNDATEPQQ
jgi:hypothetical protein